MQGTPVYDEQYYATGCGPVRYERSAHWLNFFGRAADHLIRAVRPTRVFDAGCALGFLVESFWDHGVYCEGVDVSEYAISQVRKDMARYCRVQSLTEPIHGRFDLVTCIEVLEHIAGEETETVVANLCTATDAIFFSSTPTDFSEPTHVNVQPPRYWLDLFAKYGFGPDTYFDGGFLTPHAFLVRKGLNTEDPVLQLFSDHLRLKIALHSTGWGRRTEESVDIEIYPFGGDGYSAERCFAKSIPANSWETVTVSVPGPNVAPLRVDPGDAISITEVETITVRNTLSGDVLWAADTPHQLNALDIGGTAAALKGTKSRWMLLSYGNDPQIILPDFDSSAADRLTVEMKLNVHVNMDYFGSALSDYLNATEATVNRLERQLTQLQSESIELKGRLEEMHSRMQQEVKGLHGQLASSQEMLNSVLSSSSWKMTKPLRDMMSAVRRRTRR